MRKWLLIVAAATALLAPVGALADEAKPSLTQAGGARFPDRIYALGLPRQMQLTPTAVRVTENGKPARDLQVVSAEAAKRGVFGIVLAIDASNSMKGEPIQAALAAAHTFLDQLTPNQQVAIVTFNRTASIRQPFTTEPALLDQALASTSALAEGTHVYDAIRTSLETIANAKVNAGSVVVLSDGADTGSTTTQAAVIGAATKAHVRVFTIGLRSQQFRPGPLKTLAAKTGAVYAEASSAEALEPIYRDFGARFSREYLIRYRSLAGPGVKVNVVVSVNGLQGFVRASYTTPALPLRQTPPYHQSLLDRFLQSSLSLVLVSVLVALLVSVGLSLIVRPRGRGVRSRVAEFVSVGRRDAGKKSSAVLAGKFFVGAEKPLANLPWWARFKEQVELADIRMPPIQIVLWTLVGAVVLGWTAAAVTGAPILGLAGFAVALLVYEYISRRVTRKRRLFAEQLPDNLQVLASALRAGHSLAGAMSVVVEDSAEPTKSEFRRVVADERLGVSLEDALEVVVRRMQSRDLAQVALVAALQRRTGGNSAEVLDRVTDTIRERAELRRLVRTLTTQGRMSRWILTALPLALLLIILVMNPGYISPLFTEPGGRILLVISAVMSVVGSLAIRRIVDIKI